MDKKQIAKNADRVLKNYRNFKKLASLSGAFALHAEELVTEIDKTVQGLDNTNQSILVNWYYQKANERKSRAQMCGELAITVDEYQTIRENTLLEFAKRYRNGVLEKLSESN